MKFLQVSQKWVLAVAFFILLLVALVPGVYFYQKYKKTQLLLTNPTTASKEQLQDLLKTIDKIIELPKGEDPSVATVSDKTKLQDNAFFNQAENGDKVLIYVKAKKAILYRPSANKVIDVAPVSVGTESAKLKPTGEVVQTVKVALYNGTKTVGLTAKAEGVVKAAKIDAEVTAKENAVKQDYEKTTVVLLTATKKTEAEAIAKQFSATVTTTLPEGEVKPETDILVILGADYAGE